MERLFSKDDIRAIEKDAADNFEEYYGGLVGDGNATERSIMTISKLKELIFVKGNDDTGWNHLWDRHTSNSFQQYWKPDDQGKEMLDKPSKFHGQMMPIIEYVKVADAIFTPENKNIEKNNHPDIFDVYSGTYTFKEYSEKYRLVVYKDSKVVHTLFPTGKKQNPPNRTKYAKGPVSKGFAFPAGYNDLRLPYFNAKGLTAYSLLLRKFLGEQVERFFVVIHDAAGEDLEFYVLDSRPMTGMEQYEHEDMAMFQYSDLSDYEKLINEIDRKGKIESLELARIPSSFFDTPPENEWVEVSFELNGVLGKALVKKRISDDVLYYDVSSVRFEGDPKDDFDFGSTFSILPAYLLDAGEIIWLEEGGDEESAVASAIGKGILPVKLDGNMASNRD